MKSIQFVLGDATKPVGEGPKLLAHLCNDIGAWGAGVVMSISKRWREPEMAYRRWYALASDADAGPFELGRVQFVPESGGVEIANMIAQRNVRPIDGTLPIRYEALEQCLIRVAEHAISSGESVHMPRLGVGSAGGLWQKIEPIIEATLLSRDLAVTVYDLKPWRGWKRGDTGD